VGIVVRLTRVDERLLTPLLSVAVAETKPDEVMPPVEAPPGWSQPRREAFCEFYRSHCRGLNGPTRTLIYGILCNSDVVGMIRMARSDGPDTLETGMWLVSAWPGDRREGPSVASRRGSAYRGPPRRGRNYRGERRGDQGAAPLQCRACVRRLAGSCRDPRQARKLCR
jgi:hypothetical protein